MEKREQPKVPSWIVALDVAVLGLSVAVIALPDDRGAIGTLLKGVVALLVLCHFWRLRRDRALRMSMGELFSLPPSAFSALETVGHTAVLVGLFTCAFVL